MARHKAEKFYVFIIIARLRSVPFDMMRYDSCVPAAERDAAKLDRLARGSRDPKDRVVEFRQFCRSTKGPSEDRWQSFGAEILSAGPVS